MAYSGHQRGFQTESINYNLLAYKSNQTNLSFGSIDWCHWNHIYVCQQADPAGLCTLRHCPGPCDIETCMQRMYLEHRLYLNCFRSIKSCS